MPWVVQQCLIVVFPDHTHLLFSGEQVLSSDEPNIGYLSILILFKLSDY